MKQFEVTYTEQGERDLREIHEYIAFTLLAPVVAGKLTKRIMKAVAGLRQMPERFRRYEKEPWKSRGLRVMPIGNFLVFYVSSEQPPRPKGTVSVIRIIYGARDIDAELDQTEELFLGRDY